MATITLSTVISKFLKRIALNPTEQGEVRVLIDAASTESVNLKQNTLVSASNIKTVAGQSLVGAGNVSLANMGAAPITSPGFGGTPTAPTASQNDPVSAQIATTAYVAGAVSLSVGALTGAVAPVSTTVTVSGLTGGAAAGNGTYVWDGYAYYHSSDTLWDIIQIDVDQYIRYEGLVVATSNENVATLPDLSVLWQGQGSNSGDSITVSVVIGNILAPYIGQLYRNTVLSKWHIWNGTTWDELAITAP